MIQIFQHKQWKQFDNFIFLATVLADHKSHCDQLTARIARYLCLRNKFYFRYFSRNILHQKKKSLIAMSINSHRSVAAHLLMSHFTLVAVFRVE